MRTTDERIRDELAALDLDRRIEDAVERRVNDVLTALAAAAFPAIMAADRIDIQMRRAGNGVWATPPTIQDAVLAHGKGRPIRIVAEFEGAHRTKPATSQPSRLPVGYLNTQGETT